MQSIVYFVPVKNNEPIESIQKKTEQLWIASGLSKLVSKDNFVAIKMHLGEDGGKGFIKSELVKPIVKQIKQSQAKPFITDSSTLYRGRRTNAVDHIELAYEHGFTYDKVGCPIIISDGLKGEHNLSAKADGNVLKNIHMSGIVGVVDTIIGLAHATGHMLTAYGGAIKNIGMGLASRGGKLAQHSGTRPKVDIDKCLGCKICSMWCPSNAITVTNKKMKMDYDKCIGCGECLSVCTQGAIKISWDESSVNLQKKMVEYVKGILKGKKCGFINFAMHVTKDCDCKGGKGDKPISSDAGILASIDPIALDQATIDVIIRNEGKDIFKENWENFDYNIQLEYGEKMGLGNRRYQLKEI